MRPADIRWNLALIMLTALLAISSFAVAAQKPQPPKKPVPPPQKPPSLQIPKVWHSLNSKHDFHVDATNDLFRAEWINVPPAAAQRGAYIRTECRRAGSKWVGSSSVNMLFAVPGAPAGKETKLCYFNVRFEVDSITATKITGHSEAIHAFDVKACRVQQTSWGAFTWVPKK